MNFKITSKNKHCVEISERIENGAAYYGFAFRFEKELSPEEIKIEWEERGGDFYSAYTPNVLSGGNLRPEWNPQKVKSAINVSMPFYALLSADGDCLYTFSSDDPVNPCEISFGYVEETDCVAACIKLFTAPHAPVKEYRIAFRIDRQKTDLYSACRRATDWWQSIGLASFSVPDAAFDPVYSTWYNFHQKLDEKELLKECEAACALGIKTLIVDDGWQTDDNGRGYGYCGDWQVAATKFADFSAFVQKVHALGMRVMLWYSVPYVGDYAKAYKRFNGRFLYHDEWMHTNVLDPRFKQIRQYLVNLYADALSRYGIDGFKLDFIDAFSANVGNAAPEGADCLSVEEGVYKLLEEIRTALKAIKKDVLIEFREPYYGVAVGKYADMLRVNDCPGDTLSNLSETIRMRMLSVGAAVHSDMLTCNAEAAPQTFARQLIACFFAVPQK